LAIGTTTNYSLRYPEETDAPDGATQIENLAEDVDAALLAATATQFVVPLFARKATDEARASDATLANDTSLKLTGLVSGGIYEIAAIIVYDGADDTNNLQWKFTVPSSSAGVYTYSRENEAGVYSGAYPASWTDTVTAHTTGVTAAMSVTIRGLLIAGANGTLQFQWAQHTSGATNTHVRANSYMTGRRVG
jgi:hypothetical protein